MFNVNTLHIKMLIRNNILIFDRIKLVREALNYTSQEDFSKVLNIPNRTYQSYEQGQVKNIPHSFLLKLNEQYNVSIEWVLTGKGEIFKSDTQIIDNNKTFDLKNEILQELDKLSKKQKEYYYHKIKADVLESEIKEENQ